MDTNFNSASNFSELTVFECGKEECVKDKTVSLTVKNYHLFHYIVSGKGTLILNDKKYELGKGSIFYIPPLTDAIYYSDRENPWTYEWIGFGGNQVNDILKHLNINLDNPIIFDVARKYKGIFDRLIYRYSTNGVIDLYVVGCLYELFGELMFDQDGQEKSLSSKATIKLAKEFVLNNYQFDISVVDIAKNAHVTPNYLSFLFRKEEGMSTKSYLVQVRMEKALAFIKSGQFKIKEVAQMVGYSNQLHFSNAFRNYYHDSPSKFLKK